ncbi:Phosphoglycerate kinase [Candidatus Anstonella stagnisolia]|nr:Phosphoglycerate kinase [Candidatus Anstonella stagnisolia]
MLTLDSLDFSGKRVFVRVDLNSPYDEKTGSIEKSPRLVAHCRTLKELSSKKAKVVVLAHQGRKGDPDCISLSQHAKLLGEELKRQVKFVPDVCGQPAKDAISSLGNGKILLLENVRFLEDETKCKTLEEAANSLLVRELSPQCDIFVLDAFSVSHRPHASVVGFFSKPCVAGRVMQEELSALSKVKNPARPLVFLFGGAKPDDSLGILEGWLAEGKVDTALATGVLGELFVLASGKELGKTTDFLKSTKAIDHLSHVREISDKYKGKILIPTDFAVDENGVRKEISVRKLPSEFSILDVGKKTVSLYSKTIKDAKTIIVNGPVGVYEKDEFSYGTKKLLKAVEKASSLGAFSLLGGGHTISALSKFRIKKKKLGYVSLSGKALIEYLGGAKLAGVELLLREQTPQ